MAHYREPGKKAKRQIIPDTSEKQRRNKKQPSKYITEDTFSSEYSENELEEWQSQPEVGKISTTTRREKSKKSPAQTIQDANENLGNMSFSTVIECFSDLFHGAMSDPRTTETMTKMFKPLMIQQTDHISNQIKDLKKELLAQAHKIDKAVEKIERLETNETVIKTEVDNIRNTIQHQQHFLETLDYERRKNHLVITGLTEDTPLIDDQGQRAVTDQEKVNMIFKQIGYENTEFNELKRLGEKHAGRRPRNRPLKVKVNAIQRTEILQQSKQLKNATGDLSKIYVRKDTHPGILKEQKRLREVERREREKPENRGRTVRYNWRDRTVTVDNVIVDTFNASFF